MAKCLSLLIHALDERDRSLGQLSTVTEALVVAYGVLVLQPLPTDVAARCWKGRVHACQVLVQVGAPRYEFAA